MFLPTLMYGFFADDEFYLAFSNRFLRELKPSGVYQLLFRPGNPWEFLPVRDFTYWLDLQLYGDDEFGFHLSNLLWYAVSGLGAGWLFRETLQSYRPEWSNKLSALAAAATALFLIHPAHVEPVAWVAGRKDLIAGALVLAALAAVLRATRRAGSIFWMAASLFLFFMACFSKGVAMVMVLPISAMLLPRLGESHPKQEKFSAWLFLLAFWCIALSAFAIHLHFGKELGIRLDNAPGAWVTLERASRIMAALQQIMLLPADLGIYYDVYRIGPWHWLASAAVVVASAVAVVMIQRRKQALWPMGIVLMVSPCLVYLQLMPFSTWSMASDRFVFIAVAGFVLVLIDVIGRLRSHLWVAGILAVLLAPMMIKTWGRVDDWRTDETLFSHEYHRMPEHYNPVRDYVFFVLMRSDSTMIDAAINRVEREDAKQLLHLLAKVTLANRKARKARGAGENSRAFCSDVATIYSLEASGIEGLRLERDLTFSSFLRFVHRQMYFGLGDPQQRCQLNQ